MPLGEVCPCAVGGRVLGVILNSWTYTVSLDSCSLGSVCCLADLILTAICWGRCDCLHSPEEEMETCKYKLTPVLQSANHWCTTPVGLWTHMLLTYVPKQVKHLALIGNCLSHSRALAFSQGTILCELCIVILPSCTSFFPSLLRDAQNNPGG